MHDYEYFRKAVFDELIGSGFTEEKANEIIEAEDGFKPEYGGYCRRVQNGADSDKELKDVVDGIGVCVRFDLG